MKTAEDLIRAKGGHMISAPPDTTVHAALQIMIENKIGAILIEKEGQILGIWTERDLMRNTVTEWFNPKVARIGEHMVTDLRSASHTDTVYELMDKFLGLRLRHLPIKKDGEYIGMLSVGDVIKACIREKTQELEALNGIVSWEYYEEWKWDVTGAEREVNLARD